LSSPRGGHRAHRQAPQESDQEKHGEIPTHPATKSGPVAVQADTKHPCAHLAEQFRTRCVKSPSTSDGAPLRAGLVEVSLIPGPWAKEVTRHGGGCVDITRSPGPASGNPARALIGPLPAHKLSVPAKQRLGATLKSRSSPRSSNRFPRARV
jgi:hypothetical protein